MNELVNLAKEILRGKREAGSQTHLQPGMTIYWESANGTTRGPAVVAGVFEADGQPWVWFTEGGTEHLLNSRMIVRIENPPLG